MHSGSPTLVILTTPTAAVIWFNQTVENKCDVVKSKERRCKIYLLYHALHSRWQKQPATRVDVRTGCTFVDSKILTLGASEPVPLKFGNIAVFLNVLINGGRVSGVRVQML